MKELRKRATGSNLLMICGVVWVSYFAYVDRKLDAFWVTIIGYAWFGPGFIGYIKNKSERKPDDNEKT